MIWHKRLGLIKRQQRVKGSKNKKKGNADNNKARTTTSATSASASSTADSATIVMDHSSHSEDRLWGAVEILPQRLYYAPLKFFPPETEEDDDDIDDGNTNASFKRSGRENTSNNNNNKPVHYFSIDNELIYWNFFLDFGPLNLGQLHRFCSKLNSKLSDPRYKDHVICYYSGAKGQARANATFLACAWSMLYLGRTLEESYFGFREEFSTIVEEGGKNVVVRSENDGGDNNNNTSLPPQLRSRRSSSSSNGSSSARRSSDGGSNDSGSNSSRGKGNPDGRRRRASRGLHDNDGDDRIPSPFARLHPLPPFHDASPIVCTYDLSVLDCLRGLDRARRFGFFKFADATEALPPVPPVDVPMEAGGSSSATTTDADAAIASPCGTRPPRTPSDFDVEEYEHFEQVENGDLNWIVQDKILAFAGPQATRAITPEGFCMLTPGDYIPYFRRRGVGLVVRLNGKCYDEDDFRRAGMRHCEHYYLDGSCPPLEILHAVVADMETTLEEEGGKDEAVAVHCKAGLGRTGTCIGAYLMKHYRFTAREVVGWMRICRPGMVIGPQQHFMEDIQGLMWQEGEALYGRIPREVEVVASSGHGDNDGEGGEREDAEFRTPSKTPQASPVLPESEDKVHVSTNLSGPCVSIVTPDGKPLHIPATPVARKLDLKRDAADMMMDATAAGTAPAPVSPPLHSTPSSTGSLPMTMDALKMDSPGQLVAREGDQADALLSRRLDQHRERRNEN